MHSMIVTKDITKWKANTVTLYKYNQCSVDVMDQKVQEYSVLAETLWWPVSVFYNMIHMAALHQACTGMQEIGVGFLLKLAKELIDTHLSTSKACEEESLLNKLRQ